MTRRSKPKTANKGWALYLRTSDEEAQNPEQSQSRQRFAIQKSFLDNSDIPVYAEYIDNLTGKSPLRKEYLRLLEDARAGLFSCVVVERADRSSAATFGPLKPLHFRQARARLSVSSLPPCLTGII